MTIHMRVTLTKWDCESFSLAEAIPNHETGLARGQEIVSTSRSNSNRSHPDPPILKNLGDSVSIREFNSTRLKGRNKEWIRKLFELRPTTKNILALGSADWKELERLDSTRPCSGLGREGDTVWVWVRLKHASPSGKLDKSSNNSRLVWIAGDPPDEVLVASTARQYEAGRS